MKKTNTSGLYKDIFTGTVISDLSEIDKYNLEVARIKKTRELDEAIESLRTDVASVKTLLLNLMSTIHGK